MYLFASKDDYFSNILFKKLSEKCNILFVKTKTELAEQLNNNPDKIFFFHWSYIVKKEICDKYICINLHTSNLPYGKGGSPLQNQILNNIIISKVNALRMTEQVDAGPIYCSESITLQGSLFDIWKTITDISYNLISHIILNPTIIPQEQKNIENEIIYKRRKINKICDCNGLDKMYDMIRMLDDDNYPTSYILYENFKIEFTRAKYNGKNILCDAQITQIK